MFDTLKKAQDYMHLVEDLQKLDADGKNGPDGVQYLQIMGRLPAKMEKVQAAADDIQDDLRELERLFGADITSIKERLGIK